MSRENAVASERSESVPTEDGQVIVIQSTTNISVVDSKRRPPSIWRQTISNPIGMVSLIFLAIIVVACAAAPLIAPYDPLENDLANFLQLPSAAHWLGTDQVGRDVLSRLLFGGQLTLIGVAQAVSVALLIGLPTGVLMGYFAGILDGVLSRVVDVMLALPNILILLMVFAVYGTSQTAAMIALGILFSPGVVRIVRAATISTREELYVAAARISGLRDWSVMVRHILPRIVGPVVVYTSIMTASALLVQTGLSFLGLGVELPNPSWGGMVAEAGTSLRQQPWLIVPSGGIITLTVMAFVLLGDSVRDATQDVRSSTIDNLRGDRRAAQLLAPADAPRPLSGEPVLVVRDLSVELPLRDGWTTVVDKVSFSVRAGQTVGLVGESGCGKTVTALAILGIVGGSGRISGGSIELHGVDLVQQTDAQLANVRGKRIAFISQEPMASLDPTYNVGFQLSEVVRQHNRQLSRRQVRERVIELLTQTGIHDPEFVAKKFPHQISGGMAQRVVISRALAGNPEVLIADEPTTALDSTVQAEILMLLRRLQAKHGMAVILVTHDWGVVAETCDRAIVMYAGQVVEDSDVIGLFDSPRQPYTASLMRANPHLAEPGARVVAIDGTVPAPASWPEGCRFADRCPLAVEACRRAPIPLLEVGDERYSRCIRVEALLETEARMKETV